jgi:putative hemolysin
MVIQWESLPGQNARCTSTEPAMIAGKSTGAMRHSSRVKSFGRTRSWKRWSCSKWIALGCTTLLAGCASLPTFDNRSAPGSMWPDLEKGREARALERAEAYCASEGKNADVTREDGDVVYNCVE